MIARERISEEYSRVVEYLREFFRSDITITAWIQSPNLLLKGRTPMSYIYELKGDKVLNAIESRIR